jgi:hypothetical protein
MLPTSHPACCEMLCTVSQEATPIFSVPSVPPWFNSSSYAKTPFTTVPATSVRRKSLPWYR